MSLKYLSKAFIPFLLIILLVPSLFIPTISNSSNLEDTIPEFSGSFNMSTFSFHWPIPGYTKISSAFGKR